MRSKFFILFFVSLVLKAQVLTWTPNFVTDTSSITIVYDATLGNGALKNVFPVYFHTGVITDKSTAPTDWRYVVTEWGSSNSAYQMHYLGDNKWQLHIDNIRNYYGVPEDEQILKLAFVFRNSDGSKVGRAADGSDMFIPLSQAGLNVAVVRPSEEPLFVELNSTLSILAVSEAAVKTYLYLDDSLLAETSDDSISAVITIDNYGKKRIIAVAEDSQGNRVADSAYYVCRGETPVADLPDNIEDGINYVDNSTVTLCLLAPSKKFVYVIGDFNNWEVDPAYEMYKTPDGERWWVTISNLTPSEEYAFQYFVDAQIRVADPYADKILDQWNDKYIDSQTYPNLKQYPYGKTTDAVSILQTAQPNFNWTDGSFKRPDKKNLMIYELLVRDFLEAHDFQTLKDTLDYLENLGVNTIELMPIMEFEGNLSWGYNTSFLFAPDKYYGPKEALKEFVNEAHKRGIAVVLDIVLDHAFGQSPFVRLYALDHYGPPSSDNPWLNPDMNPSEPGYQAPHPYGVGYDFNHESPYTQALVDRVNRYWIKEYHVDGYRYDLTKGFTQKYTGNDVGAWGRYDASRIRILKRMADQLWAFDNSAYIIFEHFAENSEEQELSNYGILLWGNLNHDYLEASMGYSSDLSWGVYKSRGWGAPNLVTFMESHDEERMMYKNLRWGNASGSYNIKDTATALDRVKLAGAFFFTIPGPKMIWQFEELGYDYSIDYNGRTGEKPIRWDYYRDSRRKRLYKTFAALIGLRKYSTFQTDNFSYSLNGYFKEIDLYDNSMNAVVLGNFSVATSSRNANFPHTGKWYDFFSGDSFEVNDVHRNFSFAPGEFHVFTDKKLPKPDLGGPDRVENEGALPVKFALAQNYPNPFNSRTTFEYSVPSATFENSAAHVDLTIYDILGRKVAEIVNRNVAPGKYKVNFDASNLAPGIYFYRITINGVKGLKDFTQVRKMILLK